MLYRDDAKAAQATVAELQSINPIGHFAIRADLADRNAVGAASREAINALGGLDIVVLNAGIIRPYAPFSDLTFEQWQEPFDVNVSGHVVVLHAAAGALRPGASVIFISSGAGHDPLENLSAYGVGKAALNHLATVLAQEWGPKGVRVNIVSPGGTAKEPVDYDHLTDGQKETIANTALRRIGTADDVADAVLFYASDLSSFVTGQWLRVNGGRV
jgi:NAD(P)-dependent dehydrogenase (short-subunit alcohol dehydrogenase family)